MKQARILYIYRNPQMGYSIGRVFKPIEAEMCKYCSVDALYMPVASYGVIALWKNIRAVKKKVRSAKYDIIHITGTEHYLLPFLKSQKTVITVHDLGFYTNHGWSLRKIWKYFLWVKPLKSASFITFISDKSRRESQRLIQYNMTSTEVVYNAVSLDLTFSTKKVNLLNPRILHIGTKPNKNLNNTILALKGRKCHLRIIGEIDDNIKLLLHLYQIDYSLADKLTDGEITNEYKDCDIVNFPSFYEGFGMPIIEGQAMGRVVVTSDREPMNDISGGAAVLVNPADVDSIRNGYDLAISNYDTLVGMGLKNVQRFKVETIALQYLEIYKRLTE